MNNTITIQHNDVTYILSCPCSISDLDLEITETYRAKHQVDPTEEQKGEIMALFVEQILLKGVNNADENPALSP